MTDKDAEELPKQNQSAPGYTSRSGPDNYPPACKGITLESIVTLTGEMEHLNDLVVRHVERAGGFTGMASYFSIVMPVLDMLEMEIRSHCSDEISQDQMKLIIGNWIDREIARLKDTG